MEALIKFLRNSKISSFFLNSLFATNFIIGPHHSLANLTVLVAGIGVMLAWVNPTIIMNLREEFGSSLKKMGTGVERLGLTDEAAQKLILDRMRKRAMERADADDTEVSAKEFCSQAHNHLKQHDYVSFDRIETRFARLDGLNKQLHYGHTACVATALVLIIVGYALQMRDQLNKTEEKGVSRWMTAGAASFAVGFILAAFSHWSIANRITSHQAELKLMRQMLKNKHDLFSEARAMLAAEAAGATAASVASATRPTANPLTASSAGAGDGGAGTALEAAAGTAIALSSPESTASSGSPLTAAATGRA